MDVLTSRVSLNFDDFPFPVVCRTKRRQVDVTQSYAAVKATHKLLNRIFIKISNTIESK